MKIISYDLIKNFLVRLTLLTMSMYAFATFANIENVTGHYIKVSDDLTMFYHDKGTGPILLFIPGWTMSSEVFKSQIEYFSKTYRVITIDPRSQGRSSITLENNNYTQHGEDLAKFIDKLKLKNLTIIGWSWGCHDAYAYIRIKGVSNLTAFACIDVSPKSSGEKGEWAFVNYDEWGKRIIQPMMYHRYEFTTAWAQDMVERKLKPEEMDWIVNESFHTPTYAALEMALDAIYSDYQPEAILLETHKIPTINFVSQGVYPKAQQWLQKNAPHSAIKVMGKHMMFWEHPDQFNQALDDFLKNHQ